MMICAILTPDELRDLVPDRQHGWSDETMCVWMGGAANNETIRRIKSFVKDDAAAASFQSLGQYRSELLKILST
jgi:hypothetical protein